MSSPSPDAPRRVPYLIDVNHVDDVDLFYYVLTPEMREHALTVVRGLASLLGVAGRLPTPEQIRDPRVQWPALPEAPPRADLVLVRGGRRPREDAPLAGAPLPRP